MWASAHRGQPSTSTLLERSSLSVGDVVSHEDSRSLVVTLARTRRPHVDLDILTESVQKAEKAIHRVTVDAAPD